MYAWQKRLNECIGDDPFEQWALADRLSVLLEAAKDPKAFQLRCKTDIIFFHNACVDTYNPRVRKTARDVPFFLELRQAEFLMHLHWCVEEGKDRVTLKTRYVGGSWLEESYDAHEWLFNPGYVSLNGSRTIELVDSKGIGDMKSLFAKFDYIIERLPPFVKPVGYEPKNPYKVDLLRVNPANGAQLTGEPVTPNFGSGPRATRVFIDELSKCQHKEPAWTACGQTTDSRSAVFTPQGKDFAWGLAFPDEYKEITGKSQVGRPQVFRIHWKDIPRFNRYYALSEAANTLWQASRATLLEEAGYEGVCAFLEEIATVVHNGYSPLDEIPLGMGYDDGKGSITRLMERKPLAKMPDGCVSVVYPWYEIERLKYDEAGAAQELDINFDTSVSRRVYTVQLSLSRNRNRIERDPSLPLYFGLDPGRSAGNAAFIIWVQFNYATGRYEFIREYTNEGRDAYFYVPLVNGLERDYEYLDRGQPTQADITFFEESMDPAWQVNMGYADPFAENKGASNDSWKSVFNQHDIPLRVNTAAKSPWDRVTALRSMLPYCDFSQETVPKFKRALEEIHLPPPGSGVTTATNFAYVHHAIHSHPCAAGEYIAVSEPHRNDRGNISHDNEEDYEDNGPTRGRQPVQRHNSIPIKRGIPDGYILVNGVAVPKSSLKRVSPDERYSGGNYRDGRDTAGYGIGRDRSGY